MQSWYAVTAPARTPAPVVARLHELITQVVRSDDFRARLQPLGFEPVADATPAAFGAYMAEQETVWRALVEASGATLD